jgi:hypothetical protein
MPTLQDFFGRRIRTANSSGGLSGLSIYQPLGTRGQAKSPRFAVFYACFMENEVGIYAASNYYLWAEMYIARLRGAVTYKVH